jgi:glutathione-regulated potassium-efflux system ancillary protein KefF
MPIATLVLHAHPRPTHSVVVRGLRQVFAAAPQVRVHDLYDRYPDFDIDVAAEQQALLSAQLVVWLAPVHWYSVPSLLKHWIDQVLLQGWAYGPGGEALRGKTAWWVCSTGGAADSYAPGGLHGRPFADFVAPLEQTARFCGMGWLPPFVVQGGHAASATQRAAEVDQLGGLLDAHRRTLAAAAGAGAPGPP